MTWSAAEKTACMQGRRDRLNGGSLRLVNALGQVLVNAGLDTPSGTVAADVLTFAGFPKTVAASAASTSGAPVAAAKLCNAAGQDVKTGLTVGLPNSGADVELSQLLWAAGQGVLVNGGPTLTHAP